MRLKIRGSHIRERVEVVERNKYGTLPYPDVL